MKFLYVSILYVLCSSLLFGEEYHRQSKSEEEQSAPQHSPFGFLGASGLFQFGKDTIIVKIVDKGGIAYNGGLRKDDIIVAANGRKFEKATNSVDDGGKGPR
jgi:S1-C subfamily serine protease